MNIPSEEDRSPADGMVRGPDYLKVLDAVNAAAGDEFDLTQLQAGDRLRIVTDKTIYTFRIVDPVMRDAVVESNRPERSYGPCRIMGCTIGLSSSIKPNHLFCGGNLEFTHKAGERTHTTTAIRAIEWLRIKPDDKA
jgi:hypothetical protein